MGKWVLMLLMSFSVVSYGSEMEEPATYDDREPAHAPQSKRSYPGGADEEDLRVLSRLPEAISKGDPRAVQRDVYRALYKQELKNQHQDAVEEE